MVAHRNQHGAFRSVDELALVKGIGQRLVDINRDAIRIGDPAAVENSR
ncbi:MAG TPA: helix-hairpin-helix domain-containing protein [Gammaproteobacteria bacterium]|nr:helix-hairpin-helix domain-containing protein [Gammaproteobacteria bacterium]